MKFERNKYGHVIISICGLNLSGEEEIVRLTKAGFQVGHHARACFTSKETDGYDKNHHLVASREYKVALVPATEIPNDNDRSTLNLWKISEQCGYGEPLGGLIPRIREAVSDEMMEEIGIWYITSLHKPINIINAGPRMLNTIRYDIRRRVGACWANRHRMWGIDGAFPFPIN